jgi:hypothetical protein
MWKVVQKFQPKGKLGKPMMLALVIGGVAVAAYCLGRSGSGSGGNANLSDPSAILQDGAFHHVSSDSNYDKRVVAYIYNNIPISREDLGEYLIARFGTQRVEFLVNRRIVEMECKTKGIVISDAAIEGQFQEDLKSFGKTPLTEKQFVEQILHRFNKTLYEWKEDVIRPKLMLTELARPRVHVTDEDLHKTFEAKYGDKMQCRMIVYPNETPKIKLDETWAKVSKSEEEFREAARNQFVPHLASKGGELPYPIHRHFPVAEIEKEAFSLKEGEVSRLMQLPDKTWIILKCDKHLPQDTTKTFAEERLALHTEIFQVKLQQETNVVFEELRRKATPFLLLRDETHRMDVVQGMPKEPNVQPTAYDPSGSVPPPLPEKKPD